MKTMRIFKTRGLILILGAVLGVSVAFASPAFAQAYAYGPVIVNPDGSVTYLGTLGGGSSYAFDINDSGQVVGESTTADRSTHAFITGPNGKGMTDLGTLGGAYSSATGINDSGQVVGHAATKELDQFGYPIRHAFITGPNGMGMTDLGTLGGDSSIASGINDSGQVAGSSTATTASGFTHAFITGPNGKGMTDLGTLGGDSYAAGINDSGQVVGYSFGASGYPNVFISHAFITGPNGKGMTDLGTLGSGDSSGASGINDAGQVVGYRGSHAFITGPNGMGMTDLGTLGGGDDYAADINDSGQVVGVLFSHPFITGPDGVGMTDLNSIADIPSGFYLYSATAINNLGQVIAFMAPIPEPASYALMLAGLGLVGFMARRKSAAGNIVARS